jgi:flavin reductase (DIM6/NTAB) family NADH-FMN oxidoreductase RutF
MTADPRSLDGLDGVSDTKMLRRAFGTFATGVTVMTLGGSSPHGMTANSFASVSLDPALILVCVDHHAVMHRKLPAHGRFGVSVLAQHQEHVARYFADKRRTLGQAELEVVDWYPGPRSGVPLIEAALANFECELYRSYEGGDHTIFVGRLLSVTWNEDDDALLFHGGRFATITPLQENVVSR